MSKDDADRWNSRYRKDIYNIHDHPRSFLVNRLDLVPTSGLAMDIAMGLGGIANLLINHGLRVIGVDISFVALCKVKRKLPELMAVVADMQHFYIPDNTFDVIINFLYLQRELWRPMILGLKIGGILFIECLSKEMLTIHPNINPDFLLKPGELQ